MRVQKKMYFISLKKKKSWTELVNTKKESFVKWWVKWNGINYYRIDVFIRSLIYHTYLKVKKNTWQLGLKRNKWIGKTEMSSNNHLLCWYSFLHNMFCLTIIPESVKSHHNSVKIFILMNARNMTIYLKKKQIGIFCVELQAEQISQIL